MSLKLRLESISEWVKDVGKVAEGIAEAAVESDLLEDLGDVGGVAGALCRIGARVLPQPTVEQRITRQLLGRWTALGTTVCGCQRRNSSSILGMTGANARHASVLRRISVGSLSGHLGA